MDDISTGVNEGASIPSSGDSSSPMASDSAGTQEATPIPESGAEITTAQDGVAAQESVSDATDGDASAFPFKEEDFAQAPEQWREKFNPLLAHAKSLESDLKGYKSQWGSLTEKYGDADSIASNLARLDGLGAYVTDPDTGEVVYDPNTGLPQTTTAPFLEQLHETAPAMAEQLFYDQWGTVRPDGLTYGQWALQQLGLDPARIEEYKSQPPSQQVAAGQPTADELQYIDPALHEAAKSLTAPEWAVVQSLLDKNTPEDDAVVASLLKREQERIANADFKQRFDEKIAQDDQAEVATFWHSVDTSTKQAVQEASKNSLAGLSKQIASQVTFSADPVQNAVQTNAVTGIVAAICSQEARFAVQPLLEALGVQIDPQLDSMLQAVAQAERVYTAFAQIEQRAATNPKLAQYRNSDQLQRARRESDGKQQQVMAKLAPIALKIAKALAGANQGLREASAADLANIKSRPSVGNGVASSGGGNGPIHFPKGREFDLNYRPN